MNTVEQELFNLIKEFVAHQDEECWFDHHGYCQTHNLQEKDHCTVAKAKKMIERIEQKLKKE